MLRQSNGAPLASAGGTEAVQLAACPLIVLEQVHLSMKRNHAHLPLGELAALQVHGLELPPNLRLLPLACNEKDSGRVYKHACRVERGLLGALPLTRGLLGHAGPRRRQAAGHASTHSGSRRTVARPSCSRSRLALQASLVSMPPLPAHSHNSSSPAMCAAAHPQTQRSGGPGSPCGRCTAQIRSAVPPPAPG